MFNTIITETLHDKAGCLFASYQSNITELSEWHIKIIRKCFDNSEELLYQFLCSLEDVTPYEALVLAEKVFPTPAQQEFFYIDEDGEEDWSNVRDLMRS